jgi:dihydrofolate reductase
MRRLILSMMVSLDGQTARPDGDLEWFRTDERFEEVMLSLLRSVDAILLGRVSYQLLSAFWPTAETSNAPDNAGGFTSDERRMAFARLLNSIPKVVFSRTLARAEWGPARIVSEDPAVEVARMKGEAGRDLVFFGGASLATTFMNHGLVDEYQLMVHPLVLGKGLDLFERIEAERPLALLGVEAFPSGVVFLRYEDREAGPKGRAGTR